MIIDPTPRRNEFIHVASRIFNTPLLIEPNKLQAILHAIGDRLDISVDAPTEAAFMAPKPEAFHPGFTDEDWENERYVTGRYHLRSGVAILEISGTLVHKGSWLGANSGMVSYDGLGRQMDMIANDPDAKALLINMHTYGGEVSGCFDLVDQIYQMRGSMPITSLVADAACSAGYAIASAADEVVVSQTGMAGSVGVVLTHMDVSKRAEQQGVVVTHIHAGKEKVLGTPFKALSASDRRKLQDEVDQLYDLFLDKVARNRGQSADLFRDTEAATYYAGNAVEAGLADRVDSPREVLASLIRKVSGGVSTPVNTTNDQPSNTTAASAANQKEDIMSNEKTGAAAENQAASEDQAAAIATATKAAVAADRERVTKITTCEEAKGRSAMAIHLALETDMSAEAAIALLAKAPAEAAGSSLRTAMANTAQPGMSQADSPEGEAAPVRIDTAAIFASRRKAAA